MNNISFNFSSSSSLLPQVNSPEYQCELNAKAFLDQAYERSEMFLWTVLINVVITIFWLYYEGENKVVNFFVSNIQAFCLVYQVVWAISMLMR